MVLIDMGVKLTPWAGLWALLAGCTTPRLAGMFPSLPAQGLLRFQQQLSGMLPSEPITVRWELRFRGGVVLVNVTKRTGKQTQTLAYQGAWTRGPRGLTIHAAAEQETTGLPGEISLSCMRAVLDVLPPGAILVPGDACKGDGPRPYWKPATATDLAVWHCQFDEEPAGTWNGIERQGPLSFATGRGIEWLYINNDCAGQEGAYRFLPR